MEDGRDPGRESSVPPPGTAPASRPKPSPRPSVPAQPVEAMTPDADDQPAEARRWGRRSRSQRAPRTAERSRPVFEPRHAAPIRSGADVATSDEPDRRETDKSGATVALATIVAPASESVTNGASTGRRLRRWLFARSPEPSAPPTPETPETQDPVPERSTPSTTPLTLERPMSDSPSDPPAEPAEPTQRRPAPRPRPNVRPNVPPADAVSPPPPPPPPPPRPFVRAGSDGTAARPPGPTGPAGSPVLGGAAAAAPTAPKPSAAATTSLEKPPAAAPEGTPTESLGANYRPDISRFLEASEPRADDKTSNKKERKAARRAAAQRTSEQPPPATEAPAAPEAGADPARPSFRRRHSKAMRRLTRYLVVLVILAGAAVALRTWVVQPFYIPSQSMEPTLHGCPGCNDDRVLVDKLSYRSGDVSTGDIVVFSRPKTWTDVTDSTLIKRVIGLPGDRIVIKSGFVYINGNHINEPYINKACGTHPTAPHNWPNPYVVPKGDVYVMGDNRCDSEDSRYKGPVPQSDIIGRAFMIVWPVNRITIL